MKTFIKEWREARGLSMQKLGDMIGRDKSAISRMESGKTQVKPHLLSAIGEALKVDPVALYKPPPAGTGPLAPGRAGAGLVSVSDAPPESNAAGPISTSPVGPHRDLPVFASAQGGPTGMIVQYEPIDWVKRPDPLAHVDSGFAVYIVGDSMDPALRAGDMALIHPRKPVQPGDDVFIVVAHDGGTTHSAYVKTLVSMNAETVRVKQYNPAKEIRIDRKTVSDIYPIVGSYRRR